MLTGKSTGPLDGRSQLESSREEVTASGGGVVVRRELAVCCGQDSVRRARDPLRGDGPGNIMQTESAPGCLGNDVPGQSQGTGQGEAC